jgi:hypothetical protein
MARTSKTGERGSPGQRHAASKPPEVKEQITTAGQTDTAKAIIEFPAETLRAPTVPPAAPYIHTGPEPESIPEEDRSPIEHAEPEGIPEEDRSPIEHAEPESIPEENRRAPRVQGRDRSRAGRAEPEGIPEENRVAPRVQKIDRSRVGGAEPEGIPERERPHLGRLSRSLPNLTGIALLLMLASVLLPSAYYSYHLKDPTAAQLLIAICIGLFSSLLFLWIMDAVSILRFRAEWVSKSVYGAAIVSILGTSVGVYQQAFSENKYPYEGRWNLSLINGDEIVRVLDLDIVLVYSDRSDSYWGYSDYKPAMTSQKDAAVWATLNDFGPKDGSMVLTWIDGNGSQHSLIVKVEAKRQGKLFEGTNGQTTIRLSRPN